MPIFPQALVGKWSAINVSSIITGIGILQSRTTADGSALIVEDVVLIERNVPFIDAQMNVDESCNLINVHGGLHKAPTQQQLPVLPPLHINKT